MVFESVLVDILNRYLRPYVKRLDPSQIKVGVWKGESGGGESGGIMHARAHTDTPLYSISTASILTQLHHACPK